MHEPDVTLTDFAVAIECAVLVVLLLRLAATATQRWLAVYLAGAGAASLIGGAVHGFVPDSSSATYALWWRAALLTIGITTLSLWAVAASLLRARSLARVMMVAALALALVYGALALFVTQQFWIGIVFYLPAAACALAVLIAAHRRSPSGHRAFLVTAVGLVLTIFAAGLQQMKVGIHLVYFNYNAVYHVLNGLAVFVIFWGARSLAPSTDPEPRIAARDSSHQPVGNAHP